jgi:hypothetical protein
VAGFEAERYAVMVDEELADRAAALLRSLDGDAGTTTTPSATSSPAGASTTPRAD